MKKVYGAIDSSTDFGTGWNTFGQDEEGVAPMLQEGVGGLGSDPQAFKLFSAIDQRQIIEEIKKNPRFGRKIERMLHEPNAVALVNDSARRAFLNEMDGSFPASEGEWITLRARVRDIIRGIPSAIQKQVDSMSLAQKTRALNAIARGGEIAFQLGADAPDSGSMWGGIVSGIAAAAASIYTAKITASTQKTVAKYETQTAANQTAYATQLAQAQAALAAAKDRQAAEAAAGGPVVPVTSSDGTVNYVRAAGSASSGGASSGGIPVLMWAIPLGLAVLGFGVYMVMRSR